MRGSGLFIQVAWSDVPFYLHDLACMRAECRVCNVTIDRETGVSRVSPKRTEQDISASSASPKPFGLGILLQSADSMFFLGTRPRWHCQDRSAF